MATPICVILCIEPRWTHRNPAISGGMAYPPSGGHYTEAHEREVWHMEDRRNEDPIMIPYYVHEGMMARMERVNRRFWILCIILFLGLVITNAGWIVYEAQYEDIVTTETYESDASDGGVAIANGAGEVRYYGDGEVHEEDQN